MMPADTLVIAEPDEQTNFERANTASVQHAQVSETWPAPQPLTVKSKPEDYPVDALPPCLRAAVEEVCNFVQAPLPLVASSAIAALSLVIQAHVDVKRAEKLSGPVGLYIMVVADSGERKSTCDSFFMHTIRQYEAEQEEATKAALSTHRADLNAWEAKCSAVKECIRQAAKDNKPTATHEDVLRKLEADKPEPPRIPRLLYADATPEALSYALGMQWPSGGVVSAEAGIVFGSHGMGTDSVMRNLATLNQLWDGHSLTIDRRTSESFTVRGARLTVALQVQEATLRAFFLKAGVLARGSGFMARFLVAWPHSTQGTRKFVEPPNSWPHLTEFNRRITEILTKEAPIDDRGCLEPMMLTMTPEARAEWIEFHDHIEARLAPNGNLYDVRDVASKSADNAARLAALFHVFAGETGPIGLESVESATCIVAWHLSESDRFFGELALPEELSNAARLDKWLIDRCRTEQSFAVNKSDALQRGPLRKAQKLDEALAVLSELDRVQVVREGKRLVIDVNPAIVKCEA